MSEDLIRDLMILASKEPQKMKCRNVAELLHMRQIIYGRRKRYLKDSNTDIDAKKAANNTEVRLLDKESRSIRFNSKDYQIRVANKDFEPCYLLLQPSLWDIRDQLEIVLKDEIESGTLPSQIQAKREQEEAIKAAERNAIANKPLPSPFDLIKQSQTQHEKEAQSKTAYNFPEKPQVEDKRETKEEDSSK